VNPVEPRPATGTEYRLWTPTTRLALLTGPVIAAFLVVDCVASWEFCHPQDWWCLAGVLVGTCIGQVNLIAAWAVLAPGNIVVRIPWTLLLGMLMWYALTLGNRAGGYNSPEDVVVLGTILLVGVTVTQVPLWIAKKVFRWRLHREGIDVAPSPREERQFNLKHLLIGTFLLALALAPLQEVLPPGSMAHFRPGGELFAVVGAVLLCNLLVTVPCIWGAFASRRALLPLVVGWVCYCGVLTTGGIADTVRAASGSAVERDNICVALPLSDKLLAMCGGLWRAAALSRSRISHGADELSTEAVGWIEHSEPHHLAAGSLVGLAALDPPY